MNMESPPMLIFAKRKTKNEHGDAPHAHSYQINPKKMIIKRPFTFIITKDKYKNEFNRKEASKNNSSFFKTSYIYSISFSYALINSYNATSTSTP